MTILVRHPVIENQFFRFKDVPALARPLGAGRVVRISGDREVDVINDATANVAYGFLAQKVKDPYTEMPANYLMRSDMGSSDAFVGDPVGIIHGPGTVFETDEYVDAGGDGIDAGTLLYPDDNGKLDDADSDSANAAVGMAGAVAVALNTLTAAEAAAGKMLLVSSLI